MSSEKLENLIYLITGRDKSRSYGTGFIIHKNHLVGIILPAITTGKT